MYLLRMRIHYRHKNHQKWCGAPSTGCRLVLAEGLERSEDPEDLQSEGEELTKSSAPKFMMSQEGYGPQYPAQGGARIRGPYCQSGVARLWQSTRSEGWHRAPWVFWRLVLLRRLLSHFVVCSLHPRCRKARKKALASSEPGVLPQGGSSRMSLEESSGELAVEDMEASERPSSPDSVSEKAEAERAQTATSCSAAGKAGEELGAPVGLKRKSEAGPTPPQKLRKKKRKGPPLGSTFVQAGKDNLLGVVLIKDHPYTMLTRAKSTHVQQKLMSCLV